MCVGILGLFFCWIWLFSPWSPTPFDFKTVWFIFCGSKLFSLHIFLKASLGFVHTVSSFGKKSLVVYGGRTFVHRETFFWILCRSLLSLSTVPSLFCFFFNPAETWVYHFLCKGFLFHFCEYSTCSLELVSKVILGSLTNVPALLPVFI